MSEISDDAFLDHKLAQIYRSEQDQFAPVAKQWLDKGDLKQAMEIINNLIGQSDLIVAFFGDELPVKAYTTLVEPLEQLIQQANVLTGLP
ncbi:MAG: hypothetical protein JAY71_18850 [Candidatus Thiodiazotropha weberae]|nr:hypothetical protein [Candidatus Thiodiazotropha weberae]